MGTLVRNSLWAHICAILFALNSGSHSHVLNSALSRLFGILLLSASPQICSPVASSYTSFPVGYPRIPVSDVYLFRGPTSFFGLAPALRQHLHESRRVGLLDASLLALLFYTLI